MIYRTCYKNFFRCVCWVCVEPEITPNPPNLPNLTVLSLTPSITGRPETLFAANITPDKSSTENNVPTEPSTSNNPEPDIEPEPLFVILLSLHLERLNDLIFLFNG